MWNRKIDYDQPGERRPGASAMTATIEQELNGGKQDIFAGRTIHKPRIITRASGSRRKPSCW